MKKVIILIHVLLFYMALQAQQRTVLIEQFSNASCSVCATYSPQVYAFADTNKTKTVVITYHAPFPYLHDSLHFENADDANARIQYYGVNGTPTSVMDGNFYKNATSSLVGQLAAKVDERRMAAPKYTIEVKELDVQPTKITGKVVFTSIADNSGATLKGNIVVIEKNVPKTAYKSSPGSNAEQVYKNVMRSFLSAPILHKSIGGKDSLVFVLPVDNIKSAQQVRVVAFVQNDNTKEVYQAGYNDINATVGITAVLQPNPVWAYDAVNKQYRVEWDRETTGTITVADLAGRQVLQQAISGQAALVNVDSLNTGIYLATLANAEGHYTTKIVVE